MHLQARAGQPLDQCLQPKDVDAHRCERAARLLRLLLETCDPPIVIRADHAEAAGVELGDLQSVNYTSAPNYPIFDGRGGGGGAAEAAAVPIQPGQLTFTVTVTVTYGIK